MKLLRTCIGMLLGMAALPGLADTYSCASAPVSNATSSDPGVATNGGIFYRGTADSLYYLTINGTPQYTGGTVTSEPAAVGQGLSAVAYARGSNGELWEITSSGVWTSLGGQITWNPYVVDLPSSSPRRMVFYRGTNQEIWYRERISGTWGPHTSLGGVATSSPVAVSWGNDHVAVFKRGQDNGIWYRERNAGVWTNWTSIGGYSKVDPMVVTHGVGSYAVFVGDGALVSWNKYNGVWSGWIGLGAPPTGAMNEPAAVALGNGGYAAFVRGYTEGNGLRTIYKNISIDGGATWSQWEPLMGQWSTSTGNAEAASYGSGYLVAAATTNNNVGPMQYCWGTGF